MSRLRTLSPPLDQVRVCPIIERTYERRSAQRQWCRLHVFIAVGVVNLPGGHAEEVGGGDRYPLEVPRHRARCGVGRAALDPTILNDARDLVGVVPDPALQDLSGVHDAT